MCRWLLLSLMLLAPACSDARSQREKEGALRPRADVEKDLRAQKQNLARLHANESADRRAGNSIGAWAAHRDARRVERQIRKDESR